MKRTKRTTWCPMGSNEAVKADSWKRDFGLRQVEPDAVLRGVYKIHNLLDRQAHDLKPLTEWITRTKS